MQVKGFWRQLTWRGAALHSSPRLQ